MYDHHYINHPSGSATHLVSLGRGRGVFLLHATGSNWETFLPNLRPLSQHFQVFAPDLPGCGQSSGPDFWPTPEAHVSWLEGLMDHLGLKSVALAGNSYGGMVALAAAAAIPTRIERLILLATPGAHRPDTEAAVLTLLSMIGDRGIARADLAMTRRLTPNANEELTALINQRFEDAGITLFHHLPGILSCNMAALAGRVSCPVWVVWGEEDRLLPPDGGRNWLQLIPGATFTSMTNAGHSPHVDRPLEFNPLAVRFLSGERPWTPPDRV